ncbi:ABC-2 type transport system permease protein [Verrucomicrobium sp. GAS474]|uniref:ABC transporter permease n=1 Tax=Verrucomicrobium sp. GAS474 TaxID=1882831 RepID=UPI00087A3D45|nr:ABC transporter permease [Verrucomicrobium sp. GAS474]SDT95974.1 ABC-2 type transport system permease protein [Verrucomicrobium sp. GAS474]
MFTHPFLLAVGTLTRREIVRFLRQRNRVIGAVATPLLFWFMIGSGVGSSFSGGGGVRAVSDASATNTAAYLHYFFPGTLLLIVLFTAIFSTISIIEDRREGFLQGVLVSPIPRSAFVLAKLLGGTLLAFGQSLLIYLVALNFGLPFSVPAFLLFTGTIFVLGLALTALGYLIAWPLDSTQGFHAIMNLFLMPLWFLSGALFPLSGSAKWLHCLGAANPLTYGLALIRQSLEPALARPPGSPDPLLSGGVTLAFAVVLTWASIEMTKRLAVRNP